MIRICRGGGGGAKSAPPPQISALIIARIAKFGGCVGSKGNSIWYNFHDLESISSRSNDVIKGQNWQNMNFSGNLARISKTMIDRRNLKKAMESPFNSLSIGCTQNWPQVNSFGCRGHQMWTNMFFSKNGFVNNFLPNKYRPIILTPSCFSRQGDSKNINFVNFKIWPLVKVKVKVNLT